jgi:type VI secretion system secreted protein Hcp
MRRRRIAVCTLAVLWLAMLLPAAAPAAQSFFLQADGIEGESTADRFENAIDVLGFSWGVSNDTRKAAPSFQNFSVTKYVDRASPVLLDYATGARQIATAKLTAVKAGRAPARYLRYCFTGVRVTSVSTSGDQGEDRLRENVTFSYATIVEAYQRQLADGTLQAPVFGGWDLIKNVQYGDPSC